MFALLRCDDASSYARAPACQCRHSRLLYGEQSLISSGLGNLAEILHQHLVHAPPFRFVVAEQCVVGVAGEASVIARNKIILKMPRRNITAVVHAEAFSKIFHHVAGQTKLRGSRALQMFVSTRPHRQRRQSRNTGAFSEARRVGVCDSDQIPRYYGSQLMRAIATVCGLRHRKRVRQGSGTRRSRSDTEGKSTEGVTRSSSNPCADNPMRLPTLCLRRWQRVRHSTAG
jgi:hypothetical protein